MPYFFLCRLKRRCSPCRMNAWSESGACWNVKPEKLRLLTQRVCAWASATWCYQTSPQRASAIAFPGLQEVGVINNSTHLAALKGHTGAVAVLAQGQATKAAVTTITPVREGHLCSKAGGRACREVGVHHHGATHQQEPWSPASVEVYRTAPKQWGGHPQEGAVSRPWAGVPVSPLKYLTGHTSPTHRVLAELCGSVSLPCTDVAVWWNKCCSGQKGWKRRSPSSRQFIGTHKDP